MKKLSGAMQIALILVVTSACAAHRDPIVDMKGVDTEALAQDWEECEAYTQEIQMSEGVARGTAAGAAVGAVAGAINGDVEKAAATGGLYGGARSGLEADRDKQAVFKRCLRGRGYRVLN